MAWVEVVNGSDGLLGPYPNGPKSRAGLSVIVMAVYVNDSVRTPEQVGRPSRYCE